MRLNWLYGFYNKAYYTFNYFANCVLPILYISKIYTKFICVHIYAQFFGELVIKHLLTHLIFPKSKLQKYCSIIFTSKYCRMYFLKRKKKNKNRHSYKQLEKASNPGSNINTKLLCNYVKKLILFEICQLS